jgi:hypothetical protein
MRDIKLEIVYKPIATLVPYAKNARTHSPQQVREIAASMKRFGFTNPVAIDANNGLIAGHGRILAADFLGLTEAPTLDLSHLDEREKRAYILVDNKLALNSGWDWDLLSSEIAALSSMDFDIDELGFSDHELDALLKDDKSLLGDFEFTEARADVKLAPAPAVPAIKPPREKVGPPPVDVAEDDRENYIPELKGEPLSKPGDVWILGNHLLMCADSREPGTIEALNYDRRVDMVFTDGPYGVDVVKPKKGETHGRVGTGGVTTTLNGKSNKVCKGKKYRPVAGDGDTEATRKFYQNCRANGLDNYILFGGNYFTDFLPPSPCWLVWDKVNNGNYADVEMCWTSFKKPAKLYKFTWNGLVREGSRKDELITRIHPTQKPVGLIVNIATDFPFLVCVDGFGGSGSTLIACEKMALTCRMAEMEPYYCDQIILRWQRYSGQIAVNKTTGLQYGA